MVKSKFKKPLVLKKGDKVGIIAPSSSFNRKSFNKSIKVLKSLGLVPVYDKSLFKKDLIFAGTPEHRLKSFMKMAKRKDIKCIWCVRGGAGAYSFAQKLASKEAPKQPKYFIGISDTVALHLVLNQMWKWPTIHGPLFDRLGTDKFKGIEKVCLTKTLFDPHYRLKILGGLKALGKKSTVMAPVIGGNLTILAASLGSKWEVDTRGKILFLEELCEPAYKIDRMLWQLRNASKFDGIKGVVIGDFTDCVDSNGKKRWPLIIERHFKKSKVPVLLGVHSGHGKVRMPIPFGLKTRISTRGKLCFEVIENFSHG